MDALSETIDDLDQARQVTEGFDRVLLGGFARLADTEQAALEALAGAVHGSPLGGAARAAVDALATGELLPHHLGVVAAARAAVEGARHDALLDRAAAALGFTVEQPEPAPTAAPSAADAAMMEGARQWLVEIALAGLGQLALATVSPAVHGLRHLQESPALRRLASLQTGFVHELLDAVPTAAMAEPPVRRWGDLWSRALLSTFALPDEPAARSVDGVLRPLGADVRHHDHLLSIVVHGRLQIRGEPARLVRTTLSAWKVDAVAGDELWGVVADLAPVLVDALRKPVELAVREATLLSTGDLRWDGQVEAGEAFTLWDTELRGATLSAPMPRDRHPLAIALPLVSTTGDLIEGVPLSRAGVSPHAHLDDEGQPLARLVGLLRYDDRFTIQPLAAQIGKSRRLRGPAEGIVAAAKVKKPALGILRERASVLLRA